MLHIYQRNILYIMFLLFSSNNSVGDELENQAGLSELDVVAPHTNSALITNFPFELHPDFENLMFTCDLPEREYVKDGNLIITSDLADLRSGPVPDYSETIMHLKKGHEVVEFKCRGAWLQVGAYGTGGEVGWIHGSNVALLNN